MRALRMRKKKLFSMSDGRIYVQAECKLCVRLMSAPFLRLLLFVYYRAKNLHLHYSNMFEKFSLHFGKALSEVCDKKTRRREESVDVAVKLWQWVSSDVNHDFNNKTVENTNTPPTQCRSTSRSASS